MQLRHITIESEGQNIASATGVIVRCNQNYRYLFIPSLVVNQNETDKNIRAKIVVQKKKKNDKWEQYDALKLKDLRNGEFFNVDISSSELALIIEYCNELKKLYNEDGKNKVFNSRKLIILDDENDEDSIRKMIEEMKKNPDSEQFINKLLNISPEKISNFLEMEKNIDDTVYYLSDSATNKLFDVLKAKIIKVEYLEENLSNGKEEFWQRLFTDNPNIIYSVIPTMFQLIDSKPYLGGKNIENKDGLIGDFIFQFGKHNSSIVEIKTPLTPLMKNEEYRNNVYAPSSDLVGAIVQARKQKEELIRQYYPLQYNSAKEGIHFEAMDPKIYLIIGRLGELNSSQIESFELFRRELKDVEILTFDELIDKIRLLKKALTEEQN